MPHEGKASYLRKAGLTANIIVDEGQDFGQEDIEGNRILEALCQIAQNASGSFYIFYDKLQMIQSSRIPAVIREADCKLTLYKNCRNTENIARTSMQLISDKTPEMSENTVAGCSPVMYFAGDLAGAFRAVDESIRKFEQRGYHDIVILTMKTEARSVLSDSDQMQEKNNRLYYSGQYLFTSCRKFKGLQADCVILVDFDAETFDDDGKLLFYVGASRARLELHVVSTMSANDCAVVLGKTDAKVSSLSESRKVRTQFGRKMKCIAKIIT